MREIQISDDFYDNVVRFKPREIKQVMDAVKTIMKEPDQNALRRHKLDGNKHDGLVSYSANKDIRIIAYEPNNLECYLLRFDHHDAAYLWAQNNNPKKSKDNSIQILKTESELKDQSEKDCLRYETRPESTTEILDLLPKREEGMVYLFDKFKLEYFQARQYPELYIKLLRRISSDDDVDFLIGKLPDSIEEKLFEDYSRLLDKETEKSRPVRIHVPQETQENLVSFTKIRTLTEFETWVEDLQKALDMPFAKWHTFLHPVQRKAVTKQCKGPMRLTGGAGTGKTVVGIHRAKFLLKKKWFQKVYLLTYNRTLMNNLKNISHPFFEKESLLSDVIVSTYHGFVMKMLREHDLKVPNCANTDINEFLRVAVETTELQHVDTTWNTKSKKFIYSEITDVICTHNIKELPQYIRCVRKGRKKSLSIKQKEEVWRIFEMVWTHAKKKLKMPWELLSYYLMEGIDPDRFKGAIIVDEVQDLKAPDLRVLGMLAPNANQLCLLEDMKQRIYGPGYSLKSLGINVQGRRSLHLYINYRTTAEIGDLAFKSLKNLNLKTLDRPKSLRNGSKPILIGYDSFEKELESLAQIIKTIKSNGIDNIAIVARDNRQLWKIENALKTCETKVTKLDKNHTNHIDSGIFLCTMHSVKGLEFQVVVVCGLGFSSSQNICISMQDDDTNTIEDQKLREQNLVYVALSRARDDLYVCGQNDYIKYLQSE